MASRGMHSHRSGAMSFAVVLLNRSTRHVQKLTRQQRISHTRSLLEVNHCQLEPGGRQSRAVVSICVQTDVIVLTKPRLANPGIQDRGILIGAIGRPGDRYLHDSRRAGAKNSEELRHRLSVIGDMLENVIADHQIYGAIWKRDRHEVEVSVNLGRGKVTRGEVEQAIPPELRSRIGSGAMCKTREGQRSRSLSRSSYK